MQGIGCCFLGSSHRRLGLSPSSLRKYFSCGLIAYVGIFDGLTDAPRDYRNQKTLLVLL